MSVNNMPYIKKKLRPSFDIAVERALKKDCLSAVGHILCSVEYMPPEVLDGCLNYVFTQMLRKTKLPLDVVPIIDMTLQHVFWASPKYIRFERCRGLLGSMRSEYKRRGWRRVELVDEVLKILYERNDELQAKYEDECIKRNGDLD